MFALLSTVALGGTAGAAKQTKVDTAKATARQIRNELASVSKQIQAEEARSQSARQAAAAANERLRRARAEEAAVNARLDQVRASAKALAVREYMTSSPGGAAVDFGKDAGDMARAEYLYRYAQGNADDLQDSLKAAREDKENARLSAESAARTASGRKQAVANSLNALKASRDRQLALVVAADARVQAAVRDEEASRRIVRGRVSLVTVRGITVAASIGDRLERMLSAASADGIRLGGSGYRSSDGQVAARKRNCGTSNYAVYEMPASRCRPPTARPGQSMHEQGLAIDFTYNGNVINSRSSDGYKWLKGNASRYGFYNLPSEPWHWSVNGN